MKILLIVYDNESYVNWFPQGLAYIASALLKAGHEVEIYDQAVNHYSEEHLTEYLNNHTFDVVATGMCGGYFQYKKLLSISRAINASSNRPFYIIGGHLVSPEPVYFLKKTQADAVIIGEGEITIVELINNLEDGLTEGQSFYTGSFFIDGMAYRKEDIVHVNKRRSLIKDVDSIAMPAYDLFNIKHYRLLRMPHATNKDFVMPVLSGRGCTFKCSFCYRMDEGFRPRSSESIIEEIEYLKSNYGITYIAFSDELLMSSKERTIQLCKDFIKADLDIKWDCNGRLNYATTDVLSLMKEAGCVFINYGIESVDNNVLKNMNKNLNVGQIITGVENTINSKISPGLNIIFGNIGDDELTLQKGLNFLLKYNDYSQMRTIRPVTPYPGSQLYNEAIKRGLLKNVEDFYESKHKNSDLLTVNFTEMTNEEIYAALFRVNSELIKDYFNNKSRNARTDAMELYYNNKEDFRGFRQS